MTLLLIVLLPFAGALLPVLVEPRSRIASAWAAGAVAGTTALLTLSLAPAAFSGGVEVAAWPWLPALGLDISFRLDGYSFLFASLISIIGCLIVLYARYYLSSRDPMGRFYTFLLLFMGSMLGIVLSENVLLLVLFWELTSLSSFLLIGYWNHRADARQGALMALITTGAGGLALLGGMILLGQIAGSYELSVIFERADLVRESPLFVPTLLLILAGAFTKSAQWPFHYWLPRAMAAPTPVSAYLHSATMVKAGVFLVGRLHPIFAGTDLWLILVAGAGLITMVYAAYLALFQDDIKGLLAYSTVSHLGLIMMLFGFGTPMAAAAAVLHIINHATFKCSLFMAAGIVDHEAGTRSIRQLGGLWSAMPITATLATVAAASMAGVPLLNGFLSKEMMLTEAVDMHTQFIGWALPVLATIGATFSVAYSARFIHGIFLGPPNKATPKHAHEPPRFMRFSVEFLIALVILVGILPGLLVQPVVQIATTGVLDREPPAFYIAIWHGFNLPLLLSVVALVAGVVFWRISRPIAAAQERLPDITATRIFWWLVEGVTDLSRAIIRRIQNGSLQRYAGLVFLVALAAVLTPFLEAPYSLGPLPLMRIDPVTLGGLLMLGVVTIAACVMRRRRILAFLMLGVSGLMVALTFVRFSAPDLALTQLSVEIVTTVLVILALNLLPKHTAAEPSGGIRQMLAMLLAAASGLAAMLGALALMTRDFTSISWFHLERSMPEGGGSNVVNVILVDFRGFDTLGEIIVLGIAAIGIYALVEGLLDALGGRMPAGTIARARRSRDKHPLMMAVATRLLLPLALIVAIHIFLRGHNEPGGGFVAGLVTSIAMIVLYIANGIAGTTGRMKIDYQKVIAVGVFAATVTGVGAWFAGVPFLASDYEIFHWPIVGEVELATALLFDIGVYLTVVGSILLILASLGKIETDLEADPPPVGMQRRVRPAVWEEG